MKRIILFLIAALYSIGCSKGKTEDTTGQKGSPQEKPRIRFEYGIATYNIRVKTTSDEPNNTWESRKSLVADMISKYDFDLFGTQEGHGVQVRDIRSLLPQYEYFGISDQNDSVTQHQAIFYKKAMFELLGGGNFWLAPGGPLTPPSSNPWDAAYWATVVTWIKLKDKENGYQFYVFNIHFDPSGDIAKRESANLLLTKIPEIAESFPVILMGDFNCNQTSEAYNILKNSDLLEDAYDKAGIKYSSSSTFNNWNIAPAGSSRIDHIFVTSHFPVKSHNVLTDNYNKKLPSDHFPVLVEIPRENK